MRASSTACRFHLAMQGWHIGPSDGASINSICVAELCLWNPMVFSRRVNLWRDYGSVVIRSALSSVDFPAFVGPMGSIAASVHALGSSQALGPLVAFAVARCSVRPLDVDLEAPEHSDPTTTNHGQALCVSHTAAVRACEHMGRDSHSRTSVEHRSYSRPRRRRDDYHVDGRTRHSRNLSAPYRTHRAPHATVAASYRTSADDLREAEQAHRRRLASRKHGERPFAGVNGRMARRKVVRVQRTTAALASTPSVKPRSRRA